MQTESETSGPRSQPPPVLVTEVLPPAPGAVPPLPGEHQLPHGLTRTQMIVAFIIAGVSDAISGFAAFAPPIQWVVDILTAGALFAVLGWRWLLLPGLVMEAVPGVGVIPFWVLVVSGIAVWGHVRPKLN
jgi:hypothetical protein